MLLRTRYLDLFVKFGSNAHFKINKGHKVVIEIEISWHSVHYFCLCSDSKLKNSLHKVIFMTQKSENLQLRGVARLLTTGKNCLGL